MLTQDRLKEVLSYDPATGIFINIVQRGQRGNIGKETGIMHHSGYIHIAIDNRNYMAHRLAWLYMTGEFPPECIDHINGKRSDNRFSNIRLATKKQNNENIPLRSDNKSGHRGVHWYKQTNRWKASVKHNGNRISVGYFKNIEDAVKAVKEMRDKLFTHHKTEYSA